MGVVLLLYLVIKSALQGDVGSEVESELWAGLSRPLGGFCLLELEKPWASPPPSSSAMWSCVTHHRLFLILNDFQSSQLEALTYGNMLGMHTCL